MKSLKERLLNKLDKLIDKIQWITTRLLLELEKTPRRKTEEILRRRAIGYALLNYRKLFDEDT